MSTKFFTNEAQNTLLNKIAGIFEHRKIHFFDALVGYFYASGYFQIRKFVEKAEQIRILVGIDIDKMIYRAHQQGVLFDGNIEAAQDDFFEAIKKNIQQAEYSKTVEGGMLDLIQDIISKKLIIKVHPKQNIHAKVYIFREEHKHAHGYGAVITGSSNLTASGLGRNFEFNVELREDADIDFATTTFEHLWEEAVPIQEDFVSRLTTETYLNTQITPYEIYIKFLIAYFDKRIDFDASVAADMPNGFKRLSYQIEAVNDGYAKMIKHNGFFLADVVGLGKTVIATLIAKKYYFSNGLPTHQSAILIIVPPALKENWQETIDKFRLPNVTIQTNGSLHLVKNPQKYDLIIVDEAHKFRSDNSEMYNNLQKICKAPTEHKAPDGNLVPKRVILISATPLNNKPEDIANLIYLFQDSKSSTLEVGNLQHFFREQIDSYNKLKKETDPAIIRTGVKTIYEHIRNKIITTLTVRRTRTDLNAHPQYKDDLLKQGIQFPNVGKPQKIFYQLDANLEALYDKTIRLLSHPIHGLTYNRYKAIAYLKGAQKAKYAKADVISTQLAFIMKTMLVKRIDSSFYAFKMSIARFRDATIAMDRMFAQGKIYVAPKLPVSEYINDGREEELLDMVLSKKESDDSIEVFQPHDFEPDYLLGLQHDLDILNTLHNDWAKIEQDPKLVVFVDYLKTRLFDTNINQQQKLVVFSESKETTAYLAQELPKYINHNIISVDSSNRKDKMPTIRANFDANLDRDKQKNDFDLLISTEVLAEGINLHRSNVIVNYDTPWNSTRLMQRIGRVNRIGSTANHIYVFNFFPTAQVNNDIELEKRAIMKLQAFHSALGEDSQIYSPEEETQSFGMFDKDVDDDKDEELSYLMEIRKFKTENPQEFKRIKQLPLRARVGRKKKTAKGSTIAFIRNAKRDAFLYVKPNNDIIELTFIETVHEFEARLEEKSIPLHPDHHDQVQNALLYFANKAEDQKATQQKANDKQAPNEKKALAFISDIISTAAPSTEQMELIKATQDAIHKGVFQNLQRDVNKLLAEQKKLEKQHNPHKPAVLLDKFLAIINRYPITTNQADNATTTKPDLTFNTPNIIISESFDA